MSLQLIPASTSNNISSSLPLPTPIGSKKKTKTSHACRECKRLKLKCDKKFPCSSCVKRGCSAICPDGCLVTGKGSRFVLSGSEALHDRIDVLTERIRELESALGTLQAEANLSPYSTHPLLSEDKLKIKSVPVGKSHVKPKSLPESHVNPLYGPTAESDEESEAEGPVSRHTGTLKIDEGGTSTYFGSTARSEYFLLGPEDLGLPDDPVPLQILLNSYSFPFTTLIGSQKGILQMIYEQMPEYSESKRLAEIYHERVNWFYDILPESEEYVKKLQYEFYPDAPRTPPPTASSSNSNGQGFAQPQPSGSEINPHRLALLYMIHGMGHMLDLDKEPYCADAWNCLDLAKACLAVKPVLDFPSIASIQAMFLMCYFILLGNKKPDAAWSLMGIIVKLSQSIGLHRDDFKLSDEESQERRLLWWEMVTLEGWLALGFGRPPAVRLLTVNAKFPKYKPSIVDTGYRGWMHVFGKSCLPAVLEVALGVKTPSYESLLATQKIVEDSYIPTMLKPRDDSPPVSLTFQRAMVITARSLTVMKLHLGWFSQALSESSADLRKSKYYKSVEAVHFSACSLIGSLHHLTSEEYGMVCRFGVFWSNTLSSAVPLCLIATRAPSSELAAHSLKEVEHCFEIFARGSGRCHAARQSLPVIRNLRDQAQHAMEEYHNRLNGIGTSVAPPEAEAEVSEIERLGGQTRLLRESSSTLTLRKSKSGTFQPESIPPSTSQSIGMDARYSESSLVYEQPPSNGVHIHSQQLPTVQHPGTSIQHSTSQKLPSLQEVTDQIYAQQAQKAAQQSQTVYQHHIIQPELLQPTAQGSYTHSQYAPQHHQQPVQPDHRESYEHYAQPEYTSSVYNAPQSSYQTQYEQPSSSIQIQQQQSQVENGQSGVNSHDFRYVSGMPGAVVQPHRLDIEAAQAVPTREHPSQVEISPFQHHPPYYYQDEGYQEPPQRYQEQQYSQQYPQHQTYHHHQFQAPTWPIVQPLEPQAYPTSTSTGYSQAIQQPPMHTPTNMMEMYHYTQQPDYMVTDLTSQQPPDNALFQQQQQMYQSMVSELDLGRSGPPQPQRQHQHQQHQSHPR